MACVQTAFQSSEVTLRQLARLANQAHFEVIDALGTAIERAREAGRHLCAAKAIIQRGHWERWLADNFDGSIRTARAYMMVYRRWDQILERACRQNGNALPFSIPLREALRLLRQRRPLRPVAPEPVAPEPVAPEQHPQPAAARAENAIPFPRRVDTTPSDRHREEEADARQRATPEPAPTLAALELHGLQLSFAGSAADEALRRASADSKRLFLAWLAARHEIR